MTRPTIEALTATASKATLARNPGLTRQATPFGRRGTSNIAPGIVPIQTEAGPHGPEKCPFGRCPHTGRPYRSKTEARWADEHPEHRYEALAIATPCGVYWPDFYANHREWNAGHDRLYEVKGGFIRDRAMHKVKSAIRPARALGFSGIWLAQWDDKAWTVTELQEG